MNTSPLVTTRTEDAVAVLTIDHPPLNVLNRATLLELESALQAALIDDGVRAIVITGTGQQAFSAGADVKELATLNSGEEAQQLAASGQAILQALFAASKPTICAVNGVCVGGGNELAMACHIRIASDQARFGQPEVSLGIIPGYGGTQRLPQLVGQSKAIELILTGEIISAQEALRLGLVNQVVPAGDILRQSLALAKRLAAQPRAAVREALAAILEGTSASLEMGLAQEADRFGTVSCTPDAREGTAAFIEKRQPNFQHS